MRINITELFSQTVTDVKVDRELTLETLNFGGESFQVVTPIKIDLDLTKLAEDDYLATGVITTSLKIPCNRCMDDVTSDVKADFSKELKLGFVGEDEEELHEYLDGSILDLEKFVLDEVYMNMPMKVLCSEDCKGLCKSCGNNLNRKTCDCENDNVDPRLAGLKDLLKDFKEV